MNEVPAWGTPPRSEAPMRSSPIRVIGRPMGDMERRLRSTAKAGASGVLVCLFLAIPGASDGSTLPIMVLEFVAVVAAPVLASLLLASYWFRWWEQRGAHHEAERESDGDEELLPLVHPTVGVAVPGGAKLFDLSRGGRFLVTCGPGFLASTTRVWDLDAGRLVWTCNSLELPTAVLIDDDMTLVTSTDRKLVRYDLWRHFSKGRKYQGLGPVSTLAFHPDGRHIVAGTSDGTVALVPVTSTDRPSVVGRIGSRVTALAVDAEGTRIAAGSGLGNVSVWDVKVERPVLEVENDSRAAVRAVSFRADAGLVETVDADGICHRWHVGSAQLLSTCKVPDAQQLAVDGRGDAVAVLDRDHELALWDQVSGRPTARLAQGRGIEALSARAGGTGLAAATKSHMVWIWRWPDRGGTVA